MRRVVPWHGVGFTGEERMKQLGWMLALVAGLALGGLAGWNVGTQRARNDMVIFMAQAADSDTRTMEREAARAYLQGEPVEAYHKLKALLDTYGRYIAWPETRPGERAERDGFAIAITHGRLANTCAKLGLTDEARFHLEQAIAHPRIADEATLEKRMASLDQAEGRGFGLLP
jgi:hypothetical protein